MTQKNFPNLEWRFSQQPVHFADALNFMQTEVEKIIAGTKPQMIWCLEHFAVYTAGISAKDSDLLVKTDIPIFQTNRGGKYTFHAPGMKIIYVMLDLKKFFAPQKPDVARFVEFLENWVISILAEFGIKGEIKKGRVGIWVVDENGAEKKIAAIGIKLKKWVSYHGIAINVNPDLAGFNNIIPCGIKDFGITSMAEILGKFDAKNFDQIARQKFEDLASKLTS
jgi:lipoyl(octanoyl) transferase